MRPVYFALVALCAACSLYSSGDDLEVEGEHFQYVVSELRIPTSNAMARTSALDLNGDKIADNQQGEVFGALAGQGLGVGETARESLLRGGLIMLADLQTTSFANTGVTGITGFTTFLGGDPSPAPCTDPGDLATCGQHLHGTGSFSVDASTTSDLAAGAIDGATFEAAIGQMPVEIVVDRLPLRLVLRHARVRLTAISADHISAIFAGGITSGDVDGVVIPEAAAQIQRIVATECGQPGGDPPCGCVPGSRARLLADVFDRSPRDCEITVAEVHDSSLVQSLLAPDLELGKDKLLSFGVSVELARATFQPPLP